MTVTPTEGIPANTPAQYDDYWGTDESQKFMLPDGIQFIEFKIMNEGAKAKFQRLTNSSMKINRDQTAEVKMDPATERHTLIKTSVTGWNLYKGNEPVAFGPQILDKWLEVAPPKIVEDLEFAIRLANPWMQNDMTVEEIDKEISRLEDVRRNVIDRAAGEASSATK